MSNAGGVPQTDRMERLVYLLAIGGAEVDASSVPSSARVKWEQLDAALPLTKDFTENEGGGYEYGLFTDVTPRDIGGKLNVSWVNDNFGGSVSAEMLAVRRAKAITPASARGCRILPFMVKLEEVNLNFLTGEWVGDSARWGCSMRGGSFRTGGWRLCEPLGGPAQYVPGHIAGIEKMYQAQLGIAVALQWTQNLWWHIDVALGKAPGIRLPITAESLLELWETRERGGTTRARSLVHWVQKHNRKRRSTGECDVVVRKHLRGGLSFCWNAMDVTIRPAYDDLAALHSQGLARHIPDHVALKETP